MNPPMPVQIALVFEALVTVGALVWRASSPVRQEVPVEVTLLGEDLPTDRAGQRLFGGGWLGLLVTWCAKRSGLKIGVPCFL